jgi:hypothetical protein
MIDLAMSSASQSVSPRHLKSFLLDRLAESAETSTVILAGHYALFSAGGMPSDELHEEGATDRSGMLAFTRDTWRAACESVATVGAERAKLLVLVDDVQFIRPQLEDRRMSESVAAALSNLYLGQTPSLPEYHARTMEEFGLTGDSIITYSNSRVVFSERELRNELVRYVKAPTAKSSRFLKIGNNGSDVTVVNVDGGEYQLVFSGNTNCAGAYIALQLVLRQRDIRDLIALIPGRCFGPVCTGTAIASLLGVQGFRVTNVSVDDV